MMEAVAVESKVCIKCLQEKPVSAFSSRSGKPGVLRSNCKTCGNAKSAAWRKANPDKGKENYKAWSLANPEKAHAASVAWQKRNPEKARDVGRRWREANRDLANTRTRAWQLRNPEKHKETNHRCTKAWRLANPGCVAKHQRVRRDRDQMKAPWCTWPEIFSVYERAAQLSRETGVTHEVDHVYPLLGKTVSGLNCPANLRPLPKAVNRAKGNKLPGFLAHELWDPKGKGIFHE